MKTQLHVTSTIKFLLCQVLSNSMLKVTRPGVKPRNIGLEGQCFTIKAHNPSAYSYSESLIGNTSGLLNDSSTEWASESGNTSIQWEKDYSY